jgi:FkbM family methyltransferase
MRKKIITFLRYLFDFIKHRQFRFILTAVKYELTGRTSNSPKLYKSDLGLFFTRKGTLDFQFANIAYEWNVKKFLNQHYKNYDVFIDIGANIGTYAILMANRGLRVIAFEPVADNFRALHINLLINNMQNKVAFFNVGLDETDREADFIFDPVNTGASHLASNIKEEGMHTTVRLKTLDQMIEPLNIHPDDKVLMKIDAEGMEVNVIKGASAFLGRQNHVLMILESVHSTEESIREALTNIGCFDFYRVDDLNMASEKANKL